MIARADIDWTTVVPDFTPEYLAVMRSQSGADKLRTADMLYHTALVVKKAGLRWRHADWPEDRIDREGRWMIQLSCTGA
jgi:hypothetical protein